MNQSEPKQPQPPPSTTIANLGTLPDGKVVFEIDQHLSAEQYEQLRDCLQRGLESSALAVVLPPGVRMATNPAQLDRIEQKLDALLEQTRPTEITSTLDVTTCGDIGQRLERIEEALKPPLQRWKGGPL